MPKKQKSDYEKQLREEVTRLQLQETSLKDTFKYQNAAITSMAATADQLKQETLSLKLELKETHLKNEVLMQALLDCQEMKAEKK